MRNKKLVFMRVNGLIKYGKCQHIGVIVSQILCEEVYILLMAKEAIDKCGLNALD